MAVLIYILTWIYLKICSFVCFKALANVFKKNFIPKIVIAFVGTVLCFKTY